MSKYQQQPLNWLLSLPERTLARLKEQEKQSESPPESQDSGGAKAARRQPRSHTHRRRLRAAN